MKIKNQMKGMSKISLNIQTDKFLLPEVISKYYSKYK